MTTGPGGQAMPADERLAEIYARYGSSHPVTRVMTDFAPEVTAVVSRVTPRLANSQRICRSPAEPSFPVS